ncbi:AI-2E family transporter [Rhodobacteraceae bacterium RKSG542]|uniref:AI-2E family transporter n=1 Tax=Pseudovibrio flavus TaxID=2529854 RepID=UPI0012BBBCFE|nr:AI-2E family transporter [Pseudovibrio flavus]MTI17596.1 AI-2E family transporter [Pseudovibrio flavus]
MTLRNRIYFWVGSFAAFILFLMVFSDILLPFVAGMGLAYLLDPVADYLEAKGLNRLIATFLILLLFLLFFVVVLLILGPLIGSQLAQFIDDLPQIVADLQALLTNVIGKRFPNIADMTGLELRDNLGNLMAQAATWLGKLLASIWSGGQALLSIVSLMVVTPVVAFYLLLDWDDMIARIDSWLPRQHQQTIRGLARQMDDAVAGFVRGQVMVCLVLGSFYAVALVLVGLKFGLLIGLTAGLISFIPYVGALVGFVLSIGVALVQFWDDPLWILLVLAVFGAGQFLEGNILQPKLVGKSVGLHPVWLMFALFAFGSLMGFVGMLIAIPAAAVVGVLARFALTQYLGSPFYAGFGTNNKKMDDLE